MSTPQLSPNTAGKLAVAAEPGRVIEFTCNLCGKSNRRTAAELGRENRSCSSCGSSVRVRGFLRALALELFGTNLILPDFPRLKSIRGIGTSDTSQYAPLLAEKFDYRNTFFDRAPQFDITSPPDGELGQYDFIISSEVFEHVRPPVEAAFANVCRLLKPNGVFVLTVPYSLEDHTLERFPELYDYAVTRLGQSSVLVNRTRTGALQVFDNLIFHFGGGATLEMREFSEMDLMRMLAGAGFEEVHVRGESFEPFGILYPEPWSLPIGARKGPLALSLESTREMISERAELSSAVRRARGELDQLNCTFWVRLGRKLGLLE